MTNYVSNKKMNYIPVILSRKWQDQEFLAVICGFKNVHFKL